MIEADDLRNAIIYGIQSAHDQAWNDLDEIKRLVADGKLSPDAAQIQQSAVYYVERALDAILDKLTGDWPPRR